MNRQLSLDFESPSDQAPQKKRQNTSNAPGHRQMTFRHAGIQLDYELVRSRRRSIGLLVQDEGLRITAPHWVGLKQIEEAIQAKQSWILSKLQLAQHRQQKQAADQQRWQFGGLIPLLGRPVELCSGRHPSQPDTVQIWFDGEIEQAAPASRLWLPLPKTAQTQRIREMTQGWLQQQAATWFEGRLQAFEARCKLKPSSWRLSNARARWGSCNSQGRIGLNWRLIHFEPSIIDYVIAHELAHLRHMNHSPAFWQTLKTIYPDYLQNHQKLQAYQPGDLPSV